LIVSVVKICKQCLQTASASVDKDPLPGLRPWIPLWEFRPQTHWAIAPKMKIPGPANANYVNTKRT